MPQPQPRAVLIAGPNGAGKTTFARDYLPVEDEVSAFINADLIAAGLSPFDPDRAAIQAGRLMLEAVHDAVRRRERFAVETTLSGLGYARMIPEWQRCGYHVSLIFLRLPNADADVARVAERVRQGGHDIPEPVIRRRFKKGWSYFESVYRPLVDDWTVFNNSGEAPILIARSPS